MKTAGQLGHEDPAGSAGGAKDNVVASCVSHSLTRSKSGPAANLHCA
jgi:hypothetical protein